MLFRLIVFLALLSAALSACSPSGPKFNNPDITGVDYGKDFSLNDHSGRSRTLADFRGKVVLIFFGYTQCPDVCPTTMGELKLALKQLGEDAKRVQVLFITLDPERDTPSLLAQYVPAFDPGFLGMYGDVQTTTKTAKEFKVFFQKVPGSRSDNYTMEHTAGSYVFDPQGRLRLFVRHGGRIDPLVADLRTLLRE